MSDRDRHEERHRAIILIGLVVAALAVAVVLARPDVQHPEAVQAAASIAVSSSAPLPTPPRDPELVIRTEVPSGRWVSWWTGSGPPPSRPTAGVGCVTGSLYTRTDGAPGSTLYVCEEGRWAPR